MFKEISDVINVQAPELDEKIRQRSFKSNLHFNVKIIEYE